MIFWKFCQIENVTNISNTTEKCNFNFKIFDSEAVEISEPKFPAKKLYSLKMIFWQLCQIQNVANIYKHIFSPLFHRKMRQNRNFWASEAILEGKHCSYGFHHGGWIFREWCELLIYHQIFTLRCTQQAHLLTYSCGCVKKTQNLL